MVDLNMPIGRHMAALLGGLLDHLTFVVSVAVLLAIVARGFLCDAVELRGHKIVRVGGSLDAYVPLWRVRLFSSLG